MAEPGGRRLQARFAPSSQEAWSLSAPDEGAALDGCDLSDEGQPNCCLDNGECSGAPVRRRSTVAGSKIAAVERREARVPVTRHAAPPKGARCYQRLAGAPLLTCVREKK